MQPTPYLTEIEFIFELLRAGVLNDPTRLAVAIAQEVHGGMVRDDGTPYLEEHIYPVTRDVLAYTKDFGMVECALAVQTALLHDALEDGVTLTREELERELGEAVASNVASLTKPPKTGDSWEAGAERNRRYFDAVRSAAPLAQIVKIFDRLNNLACLHKGEPDKRERYLAETREFHLPLARALDPALAARLEALLATFDS